MKQIVVSVSVVLFAAFVITAMVIVYALNPPHPTFLTLMQQPVEEIREYIFELTPIGMNMEDAREAIECHFQIEEWGYGFGMGRAFIDYRNGVSRRYTPGIDPYMPSNIGVMSIQIELGSYRGNHRGFASTFVYVAWGFDENSELIDVHVSKSIPAV
jgi:hypothetical protein